jgi:hypothetical protein
VHITAQSRDWPQARAVASDHPEHIMAGITPDKNELPLVRSPARIGRESPTIEFQPH